MDLKRQGMSLEVGDEVSLRPCHIGVETQKATESVYKCSAKAVSNVPCII